MEVPHIPETGVDEAIDEQIKNYISSLIESIIRYGNSIPTSAREEYVKQITKDFQNWYKKYPEVHSNKYVKQALIFCTMKNEEECVPMKCETLDENSVSDDDYEDYKIDNQNQ